MSEINLEETKIVEQKTKKKLLERIKDFFRNPKKRLIFIISVVGITIVLFAVGFFLINRKGTDVTEIKQTEAKPEQVEQKYPAILDGVMTDQISANRHPLAVVIENHPDARPQAGLNKASVVYEALAEGGITRFLAVFGTNEAEKAGPVRSARTYFVDWAHGYNAYLAHVGGNMDALDKIASEKTFDLDQFKYSGPYWREGGNVATEHTMFTSTVQLREQAIKNKYSEANNFTIYKYKDDPALETRPESQKVTVTFQDTPYQAVFQYDKATNSYKRFMLGKSHTDRVTKDQLNPKNIAVITVTKKPTTTRINEAGYIMTTEGSGKAKFFIDGKEITGSWKKESKSDREVFYDETGNEITFDRGQLWICVIPPDTGSVTSE